MSSASRNSSGMGMNTVTTLMAFSVSAFFVLFVFTRLLCARIHLRTTAAQQAATAAAAAAHTGDAAFPTITVEPAAVTSFPMIKFGDDHSLAPPAQEESQCTVCLEEYEAMDVVSVLPHCGHAFHLACIDTWLRQHSTCPICRASMRATAKHRASATTPPVFYAVAMARPAPPPFQAATSSSEHRDTVEVEADRPATVAPVADHTIIIEDVSAASRLEIVSDTVEDVEAEQPAAVAPVADHTIIDDVTASRLEIVSDTVETSSGAACPIAAPAPVLLSVRQPRTGTTTRQSFASADT